MQIYLVNLKKQAISFLKNGCVKMKELHMKSAGDASCGLISRQAAGLVGSRRLVAIIWVLVIVRVRSGWGEAGTSICNS